MKTIVLICCFCLLVISTGETAPPQSRYEFYFTWKNYVAGDDQNRAIYIWNGKQLGAGEKGFREVLKHLNTVRNKTTVYVFPDVATWRWKGRLPLPDQYFPFSDYWDKLRHVELRKDLNLIFTNKDQNGRTLKGL